MSHSEISSFNDNAFFQGAKRTLLNAAESIENSSEKFLKAKAEGIRFAIETYETCGPEQVKYSESVLLFQANKDESRKDASGVGSGEGIRAAVSVIGKFIGYDPSIIH